MTYQTPDEAFRHYGITPPEQFIFDGKFYRFSTNGKPSDLSGWYIGVMNGDAQYLTFGDWKIGEKHTWTSFQEADDRRSSEYKQAKKIMENMRWQSEKKQAESWEQARKKAADIWNSSRSATKDHPYLIRKVVRAHGVRVNERNQLVIPLFDEKKQLQSLQFIDEGGDKLFLSGGMVRGGHLWIGNSHDQENPKVLLVCEGFATGATLHEITGHPVVVSFNVGNLRPVLQSMTSKYGKQAQVVIAGDDDRFKEKNIGLEAAKSLAQEFGIRWVVPSWPEGSESGTDFNDLAFQVTHEDVAAVINSVLEKPAEIPPTWWISTQSGIRFSAQFAAEAWVRTQPKIICQDGMFYRFETKVWAVVNEELARAEIQRFICRGEGAAKGLLKSSYVEETFQLVKMKVQAHHRIRFNSNSLIILFQNGTLDLASGTGFTSEFNPEHYATLIRDYEFDNAATCPIWKKFIADLGFDKETVLRLQELIGYLLVPETRLQKCLMLLGKGENGKGVLLNTVRKLLGSANVSSLELGEMFDRFKIGHLENKLANICTDDDSTAVIKSSFKKIVAGEHAVAEKKFADPREIEPFARLIFSVNQMVRTRDHSEGFYRRFDILEFKKTFQKDKKDLFLDKKLAKELPGIFNWALAGLFRLIKQGWQLTPSQSMEHAGRRFRLESDPIRRFLNECCVMGHDFQVPTVELVTKYRSWSILNSSSQESTHKLTATLKSMGINRKRARATGNYIYLGLKVIL